MWKRNKKKVAGLVFLCFSLVLGACSSMEASTENDSVLNAFEGYWVSTEDTSHNPIRYFFDGDSISEMSEDGTEYFGSLKIKSKNDSEKSVELEYKIEILHILYNLTFLDSDTIDIERTEWAIDKDGDTMGTKYAEFQWKRISKSEYEEILAGDSK